MSRRYMREKLLSTDPTGPRHRGGDATVSTGEVQGAPFEVRQLSKEELVDALTDAREHTRDLLDRLDANNLVTQHSALMSPLVWDLAHIGWYEENWLLRELGASTPDREGFDEIYDAFSNPRSDRPNLPLLEPEAAWRYCDDVRSRALEHLESLDLDSGQALLAGGFVYGLVAQHELQHNETMLQTLQLRTTPYPLDDREPAGHATGPATRDRLPEATFEGGEVDVGSTHHWAYDNERPATTVRLAAYAIDSAPVTNTAYQAFIAEGGYQTESLWTPEGWSYIRSEAISAPLAWESDAEAGWTRGRLGNVEPIPEHEPVQHVSWYEADAYARWVGKRLPTEAEWEAAACWHPRERRATTYPWGDVFEPDRANVGRRRFGPSPVGAFTRGESALGCQQMTGDVWEWTSSDFLAYPDFEAFPYREYSEAFFGAEYKVLRGGSWATSPAVARASFRNWDYPSRRQLFVGFRCARDL